jgi:hypothetical protein
MNASSASRHDVRERRASQRRRAALRVVADLLEDRQLDLVVDLEWLAQAIDGVPCALGTHAATEALRARLEQLVSATHALHAVQCDAHDPQLSSLFETDAPVDAYVDAVYDVCESAAASMLAVARSLSQVMRGNARRAASSLGLAGHSVANIARVAHAAVDARIDLAARGEPFVRLGVHLDALARAAGKIVDDGDVRTG